MVLNKLSKKFQESFKKVSRVFQNSFKGVSRKIDRLEELVPGKADH